MVSAAFVATVDKTPNRQYPRPLPDERRAYVLLSDHDEVFFETLDAAEQRVATNVLRTHSGRRCIMTIEGYLAARGAA